MQRTLSSIKASQSISGEIVLANLLGKLMQLVAENAGAEKCFLIMETGGELRVEASRKDFGGQEAMVESNTLEACPDLPERIVRYVFHTSSAIILGDAANEGDFIQDPYVEKNRPRSILCMPIQHHGTVSGVLYLENNQSTDVFTPSRVEVLGVLSSQAAISIENATLYKRLELAFLASEEGARIKSEFLAKTSHELRTPLNSIINIPQALLERFQPIRMAVCRACHMAFELEPGEQVDRSTACPACQEVGQLEASDDLRFEESNQELFNYLAAIRNSGQHLLGIVNDILDYREIEIGELRLKPRTVKLCEVFREVSTIVFPMSLQGSVLIALPEVSEDWSMSADPIRLVQILKHLISNAVKFSPKGATVEVEVRQDDQTMLFSVRDHGIGIEKKNASIIFQSFRQADGSSTRGYGGSGLGLFLAKNLVDLHRGEIWFASEPGQGSTFFVRLPRSIE